MGLVSKENIFYRPKEIFYLQAILRSSNSAALAPNVSHSKWMMTDMNRCVRQIFSNIKLIECNEQSIYAFHIVHLQNWNKFSLKIGNPLFSACLCVCNNNNERNHLLDVMVFELVVANILIHEHLNEFRGNRASHSLYLSLWRDREREKSEKKRRTTENKRIRILFRCELFSIKITANLGKNGDLVRRKKRTNVTQPARVREQKHCDAYEREKKTKIIKVFNPTSSVSSSLTAFI